MPGFTTPSWRRCYIHGYIHSAQSTAWASFQLNKRRRQKSHYSLQCAGEASYQKQFCCQQLLYLKSFSSNEIPTISLWFFFYLTVFPTNYLIECNSRFKNVPIGDVFMIFKPLVTHFIEFQWIWCCSKLQMLSNIKTTTAFYSSTF